MAIFYEEAATTGASSPSTAIAVASGVADCSATEGATCFRPSTAAVGMELGYNVFSPFHFWPIVVRVYILRASVEIDTIVTLFSLLP